MYRFTTIPHIRHRPTDPIPTGTGNGITGNGAGSPESDPGSSLLEAIGGIEGLEKY
jgi:hypothetical protein